MSNRPKLSYQTADQTFKQCGRAPGSRSGLLARIMAQKGSSMQTTRTRMLHTSVNVGPCAAISASGSKPDPKRIPAGMDTLSRLLSKVVSSVCGPQSGHYGNKLRAANMREGDRRTFHCGRPTISPTTSNFWRTRQSRKSGLFTRN